MPFYADGLWTNRTRDSSSMTTSTPTSIPYLHTLNTGPHASPASSTALSNIRFFWSAPPRGRAGCGNHTSAYLVAAATSAIRGKTEIRKSEAHRLGVELHELPNVVIRKMPTALGAIPRSRWGE